jgi:hypothetical protein
MLQQRKWHNSINFKAFAFSSAYGAVTLSTKTLSIMAHNITVNHQHTNVTFYSYAEGFYAECRFAECRYVEW